MVFTVDGSLWTYTVKTVGPGGAYDYTTIDAALTANPTGNILLIVYSGTYTWPVLNKFWDRKVVVRGFGLSPQSVVINGTLGAGAPVAPEPLSDVVIEWCQLVGTAFDAILRPFQDDDIFYYNKCILIGDSTPGACAFILTDWGGAFDTWDPIVTYSNCLMNTPSHVGISGRGAGHEWLGIDAITLHRVSTSTGYVTDGFYRTGTFAESDKQAEPTAGYGYTSGSFKVVQVTGVPVNIQIGGVWELGKISLIKAGGTWRIVNSAKIQIGGAWLDTLM